MRRSIGCRIKGKIGRIFITTYRKIFITSYRRIERKIK